MDAAVQMQNNVIQQGRGRTSWRGIMSVANSERSNRLRIDRDEYPCNHIVSQTNQKVQFNLLKTGQV